MADAILDLPVETGVPIPRPRTRQWREKFRELDVGGSILVADGLLPPSRQAGLYRIAGRIGIRISVKSTNQGLRIWRVA